MPKANCSTSIEALGTRWWIEIFDTDTNEPQQIFDQLRLLVIEFEHNYSRFRHGSLITKLNIERKLENPSPELQKLLTVGQQLYRETNGVFNILLGNIMETRGYGTLHPGADARTTANPLNDLMITPEIVTLSAGLVDIGGFGKGYLIDKLATELKDTYKVRDWLVNGGGDMRVSNITGKPILIYLENPHDHTKYLEKINLQDQAFAASAPQKRSWRHPTKDCTYNHLVNTADVDSLVETSAFVTASSAVTADAYATVASILGSDTEKTLGLCTNNAVGCALVDSKGGLMANQLFPAFQ